MHPTLFEIGPFVIRSYGVAVAMAFLTAFSLLYMEAKRRGFYADKVLDLLFCIIVSGVIGARTLHVLVNLELYRYNLPEIFMVWRGGLAFYGGLISALFASWVFIRINRLPLWETADLVAPYMALGQSIGRMGCFFNGCCFGKYTTSPFFGVLFPGDTAHRHPTQLYAVLALLLMFIILRLAQKNPPFSGFVFCLYLLLYSFQRFFLDFLRDDTPRYALDMTVSQIISAVVFLSVILILSFIRRKSCIGSRI
ncbi:MAG: prolipoprotein diacylglyceryl transferase [Omnitrophica bacterium RBG_13_46_9]|nr:MAG: prolipoprotein diacylglyceryl transferase [Omnitrophica bacterium RBG_13_46_9]